MNDDLRDEILGRKVLGRYRIVLRLARGGMGVIYLARSEGAAGFARPVVVKRIIPDLTTGGMDDVAKMFVREARILANLQHPHIVGVVDFGEQDNAYIMVLEYVHGYHLGRWHKYLRLKGKLFPAQLAIHLVIQVLDALHYAHTRRGPDGKILNIVHRDVTPSNVLLDAEGHVKLADFGIARMGGDPNEYKTDDITVKGKLPYLAPELFQAKPPSPRTDVYSCGILLHELLVGQNEFRGNDMADTVNRVLTHRPSPVLSLRDDVPTAIQDVLDRALARNPPDRWQSAAEFAEELRAVRGVSEDVVQSVLTEQVHRDFFGDLPQALGIEPLDTLDAAWRDAPRSIPPRANSERPAEAAGLPTDPAIDPLARPTRGRRFVGWAVVAAMLLIAGLTATVVAMLAKPDGPQAERYIVVQPNNGSPPEVGHDPSTRPEEGQDPVDEPLAAIDAGVDSENPTGPVTNPEPSGRAQDQGPAALTRVFARRSNDIQRCFTGHAPATQGQPQIQIRFTVGTSGAVERAELVPAALGATSLGQCLLDIARSTRFGTRRAPISFRIPITAQVR